MSVTRWCCKQTGEVLDRQLTIVDTPGLFDTSLPEHTVKREISKCINMSAPGAPQVEEMFGQDAWKYTIILFTQGDKVPSDFNQLLEKAGPGLQTVLKKVENRYHVLNNLKINSRGQVLDLLEKVEEMVGANGGQFYSNYVYEGAAEMLRQREAQLRELYQEKLKEEIRSVESEYQKKLSGAVEQHREVEQRLQAELQEVRRYYRALESGVRHVVEQTTPTDSFTQLLSQFNEKLKLDFQS